MPPANTSCPELSTAIPTQCSTRSTKASCLLPRWPARVTRSIPTMWIFIARWPAVSPRLNLLHGSANAIGGLNTVVKIKYGRPVEEFIFPGAMPGIKFALGENPKRSNFTAAARTAASLSGHAHGRRGSDSRRFHARSRLQEDLGRISCGVARGDQEPDSAAPRSSARAAGRSYGRQAFRSCALLSRGRNSDADQPGQ